MKGREIGTQENENAANYIAKLFIENNLDYCTGKSYLVPFDYNGKTVYNVCGIKKESQISIWDFQGILIISEPAIKAETIFITEQMMTPVESLLW